jgi:hypothetical protein
MTRQTHVTAHTRGHTFVDAAAERERIKNQWQTNHPEIDKWVKLDNHFTIGCEYKKMRDGFNHYATLFHDGHPWQTEKVHYINRTWESYDYQSVMQKLVDKTNYLNPKEKMKIKKYLQTDPSSGYRTSTLKTVAMTAALGDVFGQTQKEKNDWKARMLKAGLGNSGLDMPEDWDTLTEDEKERRLNGAIAQLKK